MAQTENPNPQQQDLSPPTDKPLGLNRDIYLPELPPPLQQILLKGKDNARCVLELVNAAREQSLAKVNSLGELVELPYQILSVQCQSQLAEKLSPLCHRLHQSLPLKEVDASDPVALSAELSKAMFTQQLSAFESLKQSNPEIWAEILFTNYFISQGALKMIQGWLEKDLISAEQLKAMDITKTELLEVYLPFSRSLGAITDVSFIRQQCGPFFGDEFAFTQAHGQAIEFIDAYKPRIQKLIDTGALQRDSWEQFPAFLSLLKAGLSPTATQEQIQAVIDFQARLNTPWLVTLDGSLHQKTESSEYIELRLGLCDSFARTTLRQQSENLRRLADYWMKRYPRPGQFNLPETRHTTLVYPGGYGQLSWAEGQNHGSLIVINDNILEVRNNTTRFHLMMRLLNLKEKDLTAPAIISALLLETHELAHTILGQLTELIKTDPEFLALFSPDERKHLAMVDELATELLTALFACQYLSETFKASSQLNINLTSSVITAAFTEMANIMLKESSEPGTDGAPYFHSSRTLLAFLIQSGSIQSVEEPSGSAFSLHSPKQALDTYAQVLDYLHREIYSFQKPINEVAKTAGQLIIRMFQGLNPLTGEPFSPNVNRSITKLLEAIGRAGPLINTGSQSKEPLRLSLRHMFTTFPLFES